MIENGIRSRAVGRKNFLFAGSEDGARRLAIGYSIIGTCIKNGLNVRNYLNSVLKELPKRMSKNIDDLLPTNWKEPDDLTRPLFAQKRAFPIVLPGSRHTNPTLSKPKDYVLLSIISFRNTLSIQRI